MANPHGMFGHRDVFELSTKLENYHGDLPGKRSNIVGFFSVDADGNQYVSTDQIGYLRWHKFAREKINLDLTKGENESIKRREENSYTYFRYLSSHPVMVRNFSRSVLSDVGFVCNRQVLRKIANLPYQENVTETFSACLFQGNIYLCYLKPEETTNQRMERCSRWGYKFEQYILSSKPDRNPVTNTPVKEGEEFGCIFESKFGSHRIMYAAEMDGILVEHSGEKPILDVKDASEEEIVKDLNKRKFVELKTSSFDESHRNFRRFKSREIWSQSYFTGVDTIIVGLRDFNGVVDELRKFHIEDMLTIGQREWRQDVCLNFFDAFLAYVKNCLAIELVKKFEWNPKNNIMELPMVELIFERKPRSPVFIRRGREERIRPYYFSWFIEGICNTKENSKCNIICDTNENSKANMAT